MNIMISQPMKDKTPEQIKKERQYAIDFLYKQFDHNKDKINVLDTYFTDIPKNDKGLIGLGKSIQCMRDADIVVFIGDWKSYRGCKCEHYIAKKYDMPIIELDI